MHFLPISKAKAILACCVIAPRTVSSDFWEDFDISILKQHSSQLFICIHEWEH